MSDYSDDYFYGPSGCAFEEEPDGGCKTIPGRMYDDAVKKFVNILNDGAERAVTKYDYIPDNVSVAIVICDPDSGIKGVNLYSVSNENIHFISKIACTLAKSTIILHRPTGN